MEDENTYVLPDEKPVIVFNYTNPPSTSADNAETIRVLTVQAVNQRKMRLLKNRLAARESRQKKKKYIECLENRVAMLEKQNNCLTDELQAMKQLFVEKMRKET